MQIILLFADSGTLFAIANNIPIYTLENLYLKGIDLL